jgi:integrase
MKRGIKMSNTALNNVVSINLNTVYSDIQSHLSSESLSKSTKIGYEIDLRQFFIFTRNGKSLEDLTLEDLKFKNSELEKYRTHLKSLGLENTTINRKMKSIVSLYNTLKKNDYDVNVRAMEVKPLPNNSQKHGFLTFDETESMADFALFHKNGDEKFALIKLAVRTSLRKQDLLDLTWDRLFTTDDGRVYFEVIEEKTGKRTRKNISLEMYNALDKLKSDKYGDNKIFHLTLQMIETMMQNLCKQMNIDPRRGVTFHSLRKAGAGYVYELTGDISAAADQLGHANANPTRGFYVEDNGNIAGLAMDEKIDKDIFEQLSREEMVKLLMGVENGLGLQLRRRAVGIISGR